jgi:hypothetical protein
MLNMSDVLKSVAHLEVAVRGVALKLKPPLQELLDVTMRVLAEEDRLETVFQKAKSEEKEKIREALQKIKDMRRSLLRVYFSSMMLGAFKPEFVPALSYLGRKEEWFLSQKKK